MCPSYTAPIRRARTAPLDLPSAILIVNSDEYINPASTADEPPRGHLQTQLESRPSIRPSHRSHHTTARSQQDVRIASRRSQPVSRRRTPHLRKREPTWLRHRLHTQDAARQLQPHQLPQVRRRRRQHQDLQQLRRREFPPSGLPLLSPASSPPPILSPTCLSAPLSPLASSSHLIPVPYPLQGPTPDTWPKDKIAKQEVTVSNLSRLLCLHRPAPTRPWSLHPANAMPQGDP